MDVAKLVKAHINIRDHRADLKKRFDAEDAELKDKQKLIESKLLEHLNASNQDSARTEFGTFWRQVDITPSVADWHAFYEWVKKNDAFDALERRVKKTFINDYMGEHEGDAPPGVNVYREFVTRVRRA